MADETIVNGVESDSVDRTVEIGGKDDRDDLFVDFDDNDAKVSELNQKIAAIEKEKAELVREYEVISERATKLEEEMGRLESENAELKKEIEQSEADKRSLESIAARAAVLETEVTRLQHDLITSMSEGQDANAELSETKRAFEVLQKSDSEKASKIEVLEKERNLLLERFDKEAETLKDFKAESESRIGDLQKKIQSLEAREITQRSERINIEEEARGLINERETEIRQLKKWIEDLDSAGVKSGLEIERLKKEREELEIVKNDMDALLKKSERKVKEMENKTAQLQNELEAAEKTISGLKEKAAVGGPNGKPVVADRDIDEEDGVKEVMGVKLQWPVLAVSTGAFAAMAVVYYLRCVKRQ